MRPPTRSMQGMRELGTRDLRRDPIHGRRMLRGTDDSVGPASAVAGFGAAPTQPLLAAGEDVGSEVSVVRAPVRSERDLRAIRNDFTMNPPCFAPNLDGGSARHG